MFDRAAHCEARERARRAGSDGLLACNAQGERLAIILLAKAGSLVPGGGP